MPEKSTESACIECLDYIYGEIDKGHYVLGLFFDLSIAFDSVNPNLLCQAIEQAGIRSNLLRLILPYVSNRKIIVSANGSKSDLYNIDLGVVQGSVIWPLLFLMFVNSLPKNITWGQIIMFADDTAILASAPDPVQLQKQINIIINDFIAWCQCKKLLLNAEKTVCVNFYNRRPVEKINIIINNSNIRLSDSVKYLGIVIDSNLSWNTCIDNLCNKLRSAYFAILNLKDSFD